ncbi:MAG: HupE/UreJ family protein [Alphaproteobacteria bacterium]|nr:HupE/UreJ family protein [Alphaproteobacteria bacterium]
MSRIAAAVAALALLAPLPAAAHVGGDLGGLAAGLLHPLTGLDHLLAMVAVGLWAGQSGRPAVWLLPIVFPAVMAAAAAAGAAGLALPGVEVGIAASLAALGLLVALALRASPAVRAVAVGLFALVHGHAHGTELPDAAHPLLFGAGFVAATLLLHLVGIALGALPGTLAAKTVRLGGGAIAAVGAALLVGF